MDVRPDEPMMMRSLPKAATERPNKSSFDGTGFVKAVSKTGLWASADSRAAVVARIRPSTFIAYVISFQVHGLKRR
jgi:hypothetical protein